MALQEAEQTIHLSLPIGVGCGELTLLHLGGHKHAALPLTGGERTNLIVWCTGKDGVVRIRPRGGGLGGTIRTDEAEHAKYVPRPVGA